MSKMTRVEPSLFLHYYYPRVLLQSKKVHSFRHLSS
uniref:Uncharacterized protein n=1 Tax=Anguilla anguilla TaxID=7936 RepID=A0A0E9QNG8_ANGAN